MLGASEQSVGLRRRARKLRDDIINSLVADQPYAKVAAPMINSFVRSSDLLNLRPKQSACDLGALNFIEHRQATMEISAEGPTAAAQASPPAASMESTAYAHRHGYDHGHGQTRRIGRPSTLWSASRESIGRAFKVCRGIGDAW